MQHRSPVLGVTPTGTGAAFAPAVLQAFLGGMYGYAKGTMDDLRVLQEAVDVGQQRIVRMTFKLWAIGV